jgi:dTDP-4-amino-4,6-dideoxygalactose transaminase
MTEVCAAMGLTSIESVEEFVAVNKRNHRRYESALAGIKALRFVTGAARAGCNFQYVVTELNDSAAPLNRDLLIELLRAENVLSRRYFYPGCHRMEPYFSSLPLRHPLPVTERVAAQVIVLPNGTAVDEAAIDGIAAVVRFAIDHAEEVAARAGGAESAKQ